MIVFERPRRAVDRVFVHCSASDRPEHDDIAVIRDWHIGERGWRDVGYHYFIRKDGTPQRGRDTEKNPAAQRGHNNASLAVCLHGLAAEKFTAAQYATLIALCRCIDDAYGGMVTFHGHREVADKACPVFPYQTVLGLDAGGGMDFAPTVTPAASKPGGARRPTLQLTTSGPGVADLQHRLRRRSFDLAVDSLFGQVTDATVRAFQRNQHLAVDGIVGPRTWAALTG